MKGPGKTAETRMRGYPVILNKLIISVFLLKCKDERTKKFYFELDFPEGFYKNEMDFQKVMQFCPDFKPYKEWMETNENKLDKFVWKK